MGQYIYSDFSMKSILYAHNLSVKCLDSIPWTTQTEFQSNWYTFVTKCYSQLKKPTEPLWGNDFLDIMSHSLWQTDTSVGYLNLAGWKKQKFGRQNWNICLNTSQTWEKVSQILTGKTKHHRYLAVSFPDGTSNTSWRNSSHMLICFVLCVSLAHCPNKSLSVLSCLSVFWKKSVSRSCSTPVHKRSHQFLPSELTQSSTVKGNDIFDFWLMVACV